jgi:hypothetical protein
MVIYILDTLVGVVCYCKKRIYVFGLWFCVFIKSNLCVMVGVNVIDMSHLNVTMKQDIRWSFDVKYDSSIVGTVLIILTILDNYPRFSLH